MHRILDADYKIKRFQDLYVSGNINTVLDLWLKKKKLLEFSSFLENKYYHFSISYWTNVVSALLQLTLECLPFYVNLSLVIFYLKQLQGDLQMKWPNDLFSFCFKTRVKK